MHLVFAVLAGWGKVGVGQATVSVAGDRQEELAYLLGPVEYSNMTDAFPFTDIPPAYKQRSSMLDLMLPLIFIIVAI